MKLRIHLNTRAFAALVVLSLFGMSDAVLGQVNHSYPRLGCFTWGGGTPEFYAQFDYLVSYDANIAKTVKAINPNMLVLVTRDWQWGAGLSYIPNEWYVRDSKGEIIIIYTGYKLLDISDFCPPSSYYGGKRYNEYIPEWMASLIDLNYVDGVSTDGCVEQPRGTGLTDVDLDRNGINDWSEYGESWIKSTWLKGIQKATVALRDRIGNDKMVFFNSARFHDFGWSYTNGLYMEHADYTTSWRFIKEQWDKWLPVAPMPHGILVGANRAPTKTDYAYVRYFLGTSMYGDAYFEATDANSSEHFYVSYYDEFDVDLGFPKGPMRALYITGTNDKGVWVRFYDKGAVIVNIDATPHTVTDAEIRTMTGYAGPYYRFKGGQDTKVNNGQSFTDVALAGRNYSAGFIGDAIILVNTPTTAISDIVIDNVSMGTSPGSSACQFTGSWTPTNGNGGRFWTPGARSYRGIYDYSVAQAGIPAGSAVYTPTIGVAGLYEVFEWHGYLGDNADLVQEAKDIAFEVTFTKNVRASGVIDQSRNYGKWNSLGTYYFDAGTIGNTKIVQSANDVTMADAVKYVFRGERKDVIPPNEPRQIRSDVQTEHSISLSWQPPLLATDGDVAVCYKVYRGGVLIGTPIASSFTDHDLSENTSYSYSIWAVDASGNISTAASSGNFVTLADVSPPRLESIKVLGIGSLELVFSESVEQASAEDINNYSISNNISLFTAKRLTKTNLVGLTTSQHEVGRDYTFSVQNVKDQSRFSNAMGLQTMNYQGATGDTITITLSADNEYSLYINGNLIGSDSQWSVAQQYKVPSIIGKNVIAVKGIDKGGEAGFVSEIDFKGQHFVSNESWRVATIEQTGWETLTFNDAMWSNATSHGLHGVALPWAQYRNVNGISTSQNVHWIWSADYANDDIVYLRFTISSSMDITPPAPPTGVVVEKL
ncbi:hypothetical protein JW906_04940 [bacterium]|nr:hypothetical protein [bacterium]